MHLEPSAMTNLSKMRRCLRFFKELWRTIESDRRFRHRYFIEINARTTRNWKSTPAMLDTSNDGWRRKRMIWIEDPAHREI